MPIVPHDELVEKQDDTSIYEDLKNNTKDGKRTDGPTVEEYVAAGYNAANYPPTGYESKSSAEDIEAARSGKVAPLRVDKDINPGMLPDIVSENDVGKLKSGTRFLARFINDPKGDTGRNAREQINMLRTGKIIRHNIQLDYWMNHYLDRPPIAVSKGNGKWMLIE